MIIKPFAALRPPQNIVEEVECRAYDVLNSDEARQEAEGNPRSMYHINKPEINLEPGALDSDPRVYGAALEQFEKFKAEGWLLRDEKEVYYLYAQTMNDKTQYGFVVCCHSSDYKQGRIKKHELTRKDKEDDRMRHILAIRAQIGPVFLAYKESAILQGFIERYASQVPEYDFIAPIDGFRHRLWVISSDEDIQQITEAFSQMPEMYIADGHHRSAAAARVADEVALTNPNHTGTEEYNYFMAVCFPQEQLTILDYNRVVKDLNGLTEAEFLQALNKNFEVQSKGTQNYAPQELHEFSLYLGGEWYSLKAKSGVYNPDDPVGVLDVDISSRLILDEILSIKDLRTSKRIDFVGGLRGLDELKCRVDSGEMKFALALYPVTMKQIIDIADVGKIMPPKATWFEPKLRSGLFVHTF
ncbi:MAG: DUF1015 domain-containing protein [Bacteroidaceae bacterium]|jgi:uncharacterized protein (DUF1015 family)|nr:DUF1015 domain-containing protein [Bacteroidaceae bacterium]